MGNNPFIKKMNGQYYIYKENKWAIIHSLENKWAIIVFIKKHVCIL